MECLSHNDLVPLTNVVNAAIVDMYEDTGKYYDRASFMAVRGFKKLYREALPVTVHKVYLSVSPNTHTATLPIDFGKKIFVGYIDEMWRKVPLREDDELTDQRNIIDVECKDACPRCNQDRSICNELSVTEEAVLVIVNGTSQIKTIIKKLYPNGDYYLETSTPVLNLETNNIEFTTTKDFIVNFSLSPCGCLENTEENTVSLRTYCPDIYCNYYSGCLNTCNPTLGGYKIFEDTGLIQLDPRFPYTKIYVEYYGFLKKVKGRYMVPEVAFETLVEWTKHKLIANKSNISRGEKADQFIAYNRERSAMEKELGRFDLSYIMQAIMSLPKFEFDLREDEWYGCFGNSNTLTLPATASNIAAAEACGISSGSSANGSGTVTIINRATYTLAVKTGNGAGHPVDGATSYQNNLLIGATDVNYIIAAKSIETILDGDFTFNTTTGTVSRAPNTFGTGDTLIVHYNK